MNYMSSMQKTFLDIHGITKSTIETLFKAKKEGISFMMKGEGTKRKIQKIILIMSKMLLIM